MPKFKLLADYEVTLGNPRRLEAMNVAPGSVVDVPGVLVTSRKDGEEPLPGDAYIVADQSGEERAWPHALWGLVDDKPVAKSPAVKEN